EVGDGAGDAADLVVGAGAEAQFVDGGAEEFGAGVVEGRVAVELFAGQVAVKSIRPLALRLTPAGGEDAFANRRARLAIGPGAEALEGKRGHFDVDVDAVDERARQSREVA